MIGTVLGNRYEILAEVGSGGMAKVYKAKCRYLQRIVAIKVLKDEFREDSEFLKRFDTEAQAAASLTHPNIVQIYDVGRDNNRYYIVMEYVEGITLKEYITERGSLEWREAINISIQICSALSKAHSRHIIHRDIKPHNIIMNSDGVPKVADFGIARSVSNETATTKLDTVGSVHYSSPEQVRGGYTDEKSDIYSIGVTIFEMVTGKLPFEGETPVAVALQHIQDEPPVPSSLKPGIPQALDRIILKAMAKSKKDRYDSVTELINDLENIRLAPASPDILLPNVKHEGDKFSTKKLAPLGDEDLKKGGSKPPSKSGQNGDGDGDGEDRERSDNGRRFLMPVIYVTLIVAILGGIYYFVSTLVGGLLPDAQERPREVTLSSYSGRNIDEVIEELKLSNITPEITYDFNDTVDENRVIEQDPLPDTTIKVPGLTTVKLVVSKGPNMVEIPDVRYKDYNAILYHLKDELGFEVVEQSEYSEDVAINLATRTEPKGASVKKGSTITLYRSLGPEKKQVVVPELRGKTYDEAVSRLNADGLKLGTTYPEGREGYRGKIVDQFPKAGESVVQDTPIDIYFEDDGTGTGDDTPGDPTGSIQTIVIPLPQGYNFGPTVTLKGYVIDNETGEQLELSDEKDVPTDSFPRTKTVPIPAVGGVTVKFYVNDVLAVEKSY